ncbi:hypothetical protein F5X97DRAFT_341040 [Nemania serpens]|nr:hypothetical protein F5X97DRAFT_341040 [Nemania serpens]
MASSMSWRSNACQPPLQCTPAKRAPTFHWQVGDIAFLKSADEFSQAERAELLETGRVCARATSHPVIILDCSNDSRYYIITTVSAYASDEHNQYRPPWRQSAHVRKDINGFRAFKGSAKPNNTYGHLHLADNKLWPKVKTSWVYIHHPCLVPASTLIRYNKSQSRLRMTPESLQDLTSHMDAKSWAFRKQKMEIKTMTELRETAEKQTEKTWKQQDKENRPPSQSEITHGAPKPFTKTYPQSAGPKNVYIKTAGTNTAWGAQPHLSRQAWSKI